MAIDLFALSIGFLVGALLAALGMYIWLKQQTDKKLTGNQQMQIDFQVLQSKCQNTEQEILQLKEQLQQKETELRTVVSEVSKLQTDKRHLELQATNQIADLQKLQQQMKMEFENTAHKILSHNASYLQDRQHSQLDQLLKPLKERLHTFETQIAQSYEKEARERLLLQKEIQQLVEMNLKMSEDAQNLTKALKGDSKIQGNWGELVLSKILESSGLREGIEYVVQGKDLHLLSPEGRRQQPDVIIHLPEEKHIIIDAKVSLTAYERLMQAEDEMQLNHLKQHVDSVSRHIQQLGEKHYHSNAKIGSPDFVMLFMPIEAAFSEAIRAKPDLFSLAWEQKIVVVSPTTLLATLKTVASIWKLEHQNHNAREIARQGGLLYDKLVGFVEEMDRLGRQLDLANKSWEDAMRKLKDGKGNLKDRAEKLRKLGISNRKKLPS